MRSPTRIVVETLESRRLLSAALDVAMHPDDIIISPHDSSGSTPQGYSPQQISQAYAFNQVSLTGGVTGDGSGQTIAIVDAYNDPNIQADLGVFDAQYGLAAPPSLTIVGQSGGSPGSIATNGDWGGEISLDVEWAHAMAPGANILLVEAKSDSLANLLSAVDYARNAPGVSVVSMSWGSSEFSGQSYYDSYFQTPTGHQGVTFIAAAGDNGSWYGPEWPSSSQYVMSVGGTTLFTDNAGNYVRELAWNDGQGGGGGGGVSSVVGEPHYQERAQRSGMRSCPDVSYAADPNNGFAMYDSLPDSYGDVNWQEVGGTSAGSPQWAALIAIANQARGLESLPSLDGAQSTLPILYALYVRPSSPNYSTYTEYFHDVVRGWTSYSIRATPGYDLATGLGTPMANMIVQAMAGNLTAEALSTARSRAPHINISRIIAHPSVARPSSPAPSVATAMALAVPAQTGTPSAMVKALVAEVLFRGAEIVGDMAALGRLAAGDSAAAGGFSGARFTSFLADDANPAAEDIAAAAMAVQGMRTPAAADGAALIPSVVGSSAPALRFVETFSSLNPAMIFSDTLAAFAADAAADAAAVAAVGAKGPSMARAWCVTAISLAIDAAAISYWYAKRRGARGQGKATVFNTKCW